MQKNIIKMQNGKYKLSLGDNFVFFSEYRHKLLEMTCQKVMTEGVKWKKSGKTTKGPALLYLEKILRWFFCKIILKNIYWLHFQPTSFQKLMK